MIGRINLAYRPFDQLKILLLFSHILFGNKTFDWLKKYFRANSAICEIGTKYDAAAAQSEEGEERNESIGTGNFEHYIMTHTICINPLPTRIF